jgi:hyperosmotically inducible protein
MTKYARTTLAVLSLTLAAAGVPALAQTQARSTIDEVRKNLLQMPYYGVFDFMAFSYNKGTVNLVGYAYYPNLKKDAERAVKRASGVDVVQNKIEELPPSQGDDDLRWKIYYAIYTDPFLSRYAPGGGMLWGHRHAYSGPFYGLGGEPFAGMEPAGDYPMHIIVKNLHVTLLGVVDNEGDKTLAGMKARQVPGSLGFDNHLMVEKEAPKAARR